MAQNNAQTLALALISLIENDEGYNAYITRATSVINENGTADVYGFRADCKSIVIDINSDSVISIDSEDICLNSTTPASENTARDLLKTLLYGF